MGRQKKVIKQEIINQEINHVSPTVGIDRDEKDPHAFDNGVPFVFNSTSIVPPILKKSTETLVSKEDAPINPLDYSQPEYLAKAKAEKAKKDKIEHDKGGWLKDGDVQPTIKPIKTF
jgi:hypothetical protein